MKYPAAHESHLLPIIFALQLHIPSALQEVPYDPCVLQAQAGIWFLNVETVELIQYEYVCEWVILPWHVGKLKYPAAHESHLLPMILALQLHIPLALQELPFDPSVLQLQAEI